MYGPRQYPEKLIPKFILRLNDNKPCCIHGSGTSKRHFIHVDDVVRAFDLIVHKGVIGETYNIGSQYEFENIEVAKTLIAYIKMGDNDKWITWVKDRPFNDVRYFLSYDKLLKLGWSPKIEFMDGLKRTIEWYSRVRPSEYWSHKVATALEAHPL